MTSENTIENMFANCILAFIVIFCILIFILKRKILLTIVFILILIVFCLCTSVVEIPIDMSIIAGAIILLAAKFITKRNYIASMLALISIITVVCSFMTTNRKSRQETLIFSLGLVCFSIVAYL